MDARNLGHLEGIFRAAIQDTKIRSLQICDGELELGVALDVLSSPGCQLRSLLGIGLDLSSIGVGDTPTPTSTNTSVSELALGNPRLLSSHLTGICSTSTSLTGLHLHSTYFQDISPLYTLLVLGDNLTLQHLSLTNCGIGETCIIDFFRKLPQMHCIQRVTLANNPFVGSQKWMDVLSSAIQRNTSLEKLHLSHTKVWGKYSRLEARGGIGRESSMMETVHGESCCGEKYQDALLRVLGC